MINPPTLLTLVHAVQQPIGRARVCRAQHRAQRSDGRLYLQLDRMRGPDRPTRAHSHHGLAASPRNVRLPDGRAPDSRRQHGQGGRARRMGRPDRRPRQAVSRKPVRDTRGRAAAPPPARRLPGGAWQEKRRVGYYDPENDQIAMVRYGDHTGPASASSKYFPRPRPNTNSATPNGTGALQGRWPRRATASTSCRWRGGSYLHAISESSISRRARIRAPARSRRRVRRPYIRVAAPGRHQHEAKRALRRRPARLPGTRLVFVRRRRASRASRSGTALTAC